MELLSTQGLDSIIEPSMKQYIQKLYEKYTSEYLNICWGDITDSLNTDIQVTEEKDGKPKKSAAKIIKKRFTV